MQNNENIRKEETPAENSQPERIDPVEEHQEESRLEQMQKARQENKAAKQKKKSTSKKSPAAIIAVCAAVLCFVLILALGGGGKNSAVKYDETTIQTEAAKRSVLNVGVPNGGYPPFIFEAYGGGYSGTDYDLMKAVCNKYGWKLNVVFIDWTNRQTALDDGTVDCLWAGFNPYGREDAYAWTRTYLDESDVLVVKSSNKDIKDFDSLEGKTVAAIDGSTAYSSLEGLGVGMKRRAYSTLEACQEALNNGDVDAIAVSGTEVDNLKNVKTVEEIDNRTYAVACALGNESLRDVIDAALADLT